MEIRYPVRDANGKQFVRPESLLSLLHKEQHGQWLSGQHGMWHGGIHISRNSVPWSAILQENTGEAIPLQCVADGDIIAWRLSEDYFSGNLGTTSLKYSTSFLLVRSEHKPASDASTWLTFYTLYMHLAPLSVYPKRNIYQVTQKGNNVRMRKYTGGEHSGQAAPEVIPGGVLKTGDQLLIEQQETFILDDGKKDVFGLAQKINNGVPDGQKFWSSIRPEYAQPKEDRGGNFPSWMREAIKEEKYDAVASPSTPFKIKAGDAVGFLAREDAPDQYNTITTDWFTHIEVFSRDSNMPNFLKNPGKLKTGRQYLLVKSGQPLYQIEEKDGKRIFHPLDVMTNADTGKIILREMAHPFEEAGVMWFQIRPHTWIDENGVKELSQHDLAELKFTALEQESSHNFHSSIMDKWVSTAFKWLSGEVLPERGLECKTMSDFYSRMADKLDLNRDGKLSAGEMALYQESVAAGLRHPNKDIALLLRRLVVKHESEWYGDSSHPKWQAVLEKLSGDRLEYTKQWLDAHEWMGQVPELNNDEPLWHFHPLEFVDAIKSSGRFSYKYTHYDITLEQALDIQLKLGTRGGPTMQKGHGFPRITKEETRPYFDPELHMTEPDLFQYFDISMKVDVTEEQMSKYLSNKGILQGQANTFLNAAEKYGVNAIYLAVHASLETGNGTSPLGTGIIREGEKVYNMYGIGAFDGKAVATGSAMAKKQGWNSVEKAIDGGAAWIASHYVRAKQNTLYKMRWNPEKPGTHQYATAANWALAQSKTLRRECDQFPDVTLPLDIPVYKK